MQKLPREKAATIIDFTDLSDKNFEDLLSSVLAEEGMKRFTPDGVCRIDPRTGIRVLYSEKRAKRPHDNKPDEAEEAAPPVQKACPVCEGNTTRIVDMADLSALRQLFYWVLSFQWESLHTALHREKIFYLHYFP